MAKYANNHLEILISWYQSYWHDCSLLVFVRVIAKAITYHRRFQNIALTNFVEILLRLGYKTFTYN